MTNYVKTIIAREGLANEKQNDLASRMHRMINLFVDGIAIECICVIIFGVLVFAIWLGTLSNEKQFDLAEIARLYKNSLVFHFFIAYVYYFLFESLCGKTLGKYFTNTKVVRQDRAQPTYRDIAHRTFIRFLPPDIISYLISTSDRPVGFHDRFSKTLVVLENPNGRIKFDLLGFLWKARYPYVMHD
jgi:uncharacterized RDD family membrane protein YckC